MTSPYPATFRSEEGFALELDRRDPLAPYREKFHIPRGESGQPVVYLCGNSLGLQPVTARERVEEELEAWSRLAVAGHFEGKNPWFSFHEIVREPMATIVGALPDEVVMMNGLTVNLHLMMVSFYRPTAKRHRILVEDPAFPSDVYAVKSQIRHHGFEPEDSLLVARPRKGESVLRTEDIEALLEERGKEIALVMMGGVNYFTGQAFAMERITAAARRQGSVVGWDLAHAAGNLVLRLHDWDVDFAVWCSYKYLNSGPGAVGGCFVHRRNAGKSDLERFAGWWGNDPETRFLRHADPEFLPVHSADGWQLSNPPILSLAPVKASLEIFDQAGMEALRAKSVALTGYLHHRIGEIPTERLRVITPRDPAARGCQLSLQVQDRAPELFRALRDEGVVGDFREPDVIRVAPVPLYNSFHDVWRFARILEGSVP